MRDQDQQPMTPDATPRERDVIVCVRLAAHPRASLLLRAARALEACRGVQQIDVPPDAHVTLRAVELREELPTSYFPPVHE